MRFFRWPANLALVGWLYVLGTSGARTLAYGMGSLVLGLVVFPIWDRGKSAPRPIAPDLD